MTGDAKINELVQRACEWVDKASPAGLWDVLRHGGIDGRVGMPGLMKGLGTLSGPGPFESDLKAREWAASAEGDEDDLADWFANNTAAQAAARDEIRAEITELFFDLGEWEWKGVAPGANDSKCSPS